MKNLAVTIPSKGRLYGETFNLVKKINENITGVYVYVDETEYEAYSEEYSSIFTIVPHDKKSINEIRLFIQNHQHGLGSDMLMMDDDIKGFKDIERRQISINRIIREAKEALEAVPFIYFFHEGQQELAKNTDNIEYGIFTPASAVCASSDLFDTGIRYRSNVISEDFDFYFQLLLNDTETVLLPFFIDKNNDPSLSHFDLEFRNSSIIETYLKYGDVIELRQNYDTLLPNIAGSKIKDYKLRGPSYTPESDSILENIRINRFPGYRLLEDREIAEDA
jgi:hypothetical protein